MRRLILGMLPAIFVLGCYGVGDYRQAENPSVKYIDPEEYRVDSKLYPKYRAIRDFQPPDLAPNPYNEARLRMPRITPAYEWEVRYTVGSELWLYSRKYHEAICQIKECYGSLLSKLGSSLTLVSILSDGRVQDGWRGVSESKQVMLKGDRLIPLNPDPRFALDWGNEPLFEPIKQ